MATNFFFNNFKSSGEQTLLEDLIIESIRIYGQDMYYIPRKLNARDKVYGEDTISSYDSAYLVELYIKNVDGFSGDGNFLSKFGLEIRDQITFTIAKRVFDDEIGTIEDFIRPREGDVLYFPLNRKLFQIKYVDNKPIFYQLGALQVFDLTCELFEYSGERFNTGLSEIDSIQSNHSSDLFDYAILTEDGQQILSEDSNTILVTEGYDIESFDPFADNDSVQKESDTFLDWSELNPFSVDGRF